jgi:hypothetical protein
MSSIRIAPDVCLFLLEEQGAFFAEDRQELYVFNTPATFVWCCLEERYEPDEIVSAYAAAFGITIAEAEGHVLGLLQQWEGLGYIAGAAASNLPETHLTTALSWLLTNSALRGDFARSATDMAQRLHIRAPDLEAFVGIDPAALEAQAEAVTRTWRRRAPRSGAEHVLASVGANGRSVLELAAEARLQSVAATSIKRFYRLLATHFCLRLDSRAQDARVHPALAHLEIDVPPTIDVVLDILEADSGHLLLQDLLPVGHCMGLDQLAPMVKARVRQTAIDRYRYFMAVHAGVVGNGERCLLFPGAPGRGKTTLTAALSREGFHYFSDEFALLEERTLHVPPVPVSLTVKPGATGLLTRYYPELERLPPHLREDGQTVYYLNPAGRSAESGRSCPVGWIIFPQYAPDVVTELRPVSRPDALRRLLRECLVLPERLDRGGVESLVHWIRSVECLELPMSSLEDAVDLIKRLGSHTGT